jgi:hypothetical protein
MPADRERRGGPSEPRLLPEHSASEPHTSALHGHDVLTATARTFARELGRQAYHELRRREDTDGR